MKKLNQRYQIKNKLGESSNSIVYKAIDNISKKYVTIKILKKNNGKSLKLFKKEYLINKRLQHPNIRKAYSFEKVFYIDENPVTSERYFQVLEYIDKTYKNIKIETLKKKKKYYNQIINALKFIYENNLHHGDIKSNNILVTSNNDIKIADISPFIKVEKKENVDIKKINKVLRKKNIIINKTINNIEDYFKTDLFDKNIYLETVYKHLNNSNFPLEYILNEKEIKNIVSSKQIINLYNPSSINNSDYFLRRIHQYYEIENYQYIHINDYEPNKNFNIIKELVKKSIKYDYLNEIIFEYGKEFVKIYKNLPFDPSEKLSNDNAEKSKLINLSVNLVKEITKKTNFLIIINNYSTIDKYSKRFLKNLKDIIKKDKLKIITSNNKKIEDALFKNIKIGKLSFDIFKSHHHFFLYYYSISDTHLKKIYQITNGEIYLLTSGIQKLISKKAFLIKYNKIFTKKDLEYYFDYTKNIKSIYKNLNREEKNLLRLFKIYNNYFPKILLEKEEASFKKSFKNLINKNILIEYSSYFFVRHNYLLELIDKTLPDKLLKKQSNIIKKLFDSEGIFITLYQKVNFFLENYQSSFKDIFKYFSSMDDKNMNYDKSKYFEIFKKYKSYENKLNKNNRFNLNWVLYRLDINNEFNKKQLIDTMEKNITTKVQKFYWLSYNIRNDKNITIENLKSYYHFFEKDEMYTNKKYNYLLLSILIKLDELGYHEQCKKLYEKYILDKINNLSNNQKFQFYNSYLITNLDSNNLTKAEKIGKTILNLIQESDDFNKEDIFRAYNNTAIIKLRKNNYNEALKYFYKAEETVKNINNYDLLSTVNVNIGVINYYQNNFLEYEKYMNKALDYSQKINDYNTMYTSISNLIEYYLFQYNFKKVENLISLGKNNFNNVKSNIRKNGFIQNQIYFLYYFKKLDQAKKLLNKIEKFYVKINPLLENSVSYHVLYSINLYLSNSNCQNYIFNLLDDDSISKTKKGKYNFLSQVIINLFEFDYPENKLNKLATFLYRNYQKQYKQDNIINKTLLDLILGNFNITEFQKNHFTHNKIKLLKHRLFYYFYILKNNKSKNDLYMESVLKYRMILEKIYNNSADNNLNLFKKTFFYQKFFNLKYSNKYIKDISIKDFKKSNIQLAARRIVEKRNKFINKAHFKKLKSKSEIINNFINDALKLTGMQRGIYYEYDIDKGWQKIREIYDKINYFKNEPVNKELLDNVILSQNDEMKILENPNPEENDITKAMALPIIDLNVSREINFEDDRSTPTRNLIDLKGFFYLDTKCQLHKPTKKDLNHSYYLREFTNVYFQNLFLVNSTMKDSQTKLYKREVWISLTKNLIKNSRKENKYVGVLLADIDNFKDINDRYGHPKGDVVLKRISDIFKKQLRDIDKIGRYGGEEFIFSILTNKKNEIEMVAKRITNAISKNTIIKDRKITISMGASIYPDDGNFINELIEKADNALIQAKNSGKNKVVLWGNIKNMNKKAVRKNIIIEDPIRQSDKLNLIFSLTDKINYKNNWKKVIKDINNEILLKLKEGNLILIMQKNDNFILSDNKYKTKINKSLKKKLDDNTLLISSQVLRNKNYDKIGLYLNINNLEITKHKKYYHYIGKIILEKLLLYSIK